MKKYSQKTRRHLTSYSGVYEREAERVIGKPDICYDISYTIDRKKVWEKVGWKSLGYSAKMVSQIRSERIRALRHGDELRMNKPKPPFFREMMEKYLAWAETSKANGKTTDNYLYQGHLKFFDDKRLNEIQPLELERLKANILKKGLSPATAKHILVLVGEVFNKSIHWNLYKGDNPVKKVKMPILQNRRERFLIYEEANRLLSVAKNKSEQLHDICLLSLHCGLRAGEIFNLRGQDIDFKNDIIHIADPKNKEPRKAFMNKRVKKMLKSRMPETLGDLIFKDKKGQKIASVSRTFERVVEELKLNEGIDDPRQKIVFHSLRHTFASWLALQGETILTIKDLLGHKTLAMTTRYAHLMPEHKRQATLNLEKAFNKKRGETHAKKG